MLKFKFDRDLSKHDEVVGIKLRRRWNVDFVLRRYGEGEGIVIYVTNGLDILLDA